MFLFCLLFVITKVNRCAKWENSRLRMGKEIVDRDRMRLDAREVALYTVSGSRLTPCRTFWLRGVAAPRGRRGEMEDSGGFGEGLRSWRKRGVNGQRVGSEDHVVAETRVRRCRRRVQCASAF